MFEKVRKINWSEKKKLFGNLLRCGIFFLKTQELKKENTEISQIRGNMNEAINKTNNIFFLNLSKQLSERW
jgi:hypothetical protein